jgi:hypothetical protein
MNIIAVTASSSSSCKLFMRIHTTSTTIIIINNIIVPLLILPLRLGGASTIELQSSSQLGEIIMVKIRCLKALSGVVQVHKRMGCRGAEVGHGG